MNLSGISFPYFLMALNQGLEDVDRLLSLAPTRRSTTSSPRQSADAVYRSSVVLLCATWEAFLEDLALAALIRVVAHHDAGRPLTALGQEVAVRAARQIAIAEIRWQDPAAVLRNRTKLLGPFDTPKTANTDKLFERVLDLPGISRSWTWSRGTWRPITPAQAGQELDSLVSLRGDIAHRKKGLRSPLKADVTGYERLIEHLAWASCNRVREWLLAACEDATYWDEIPFSAVA